MDTQLLNPTLANKVYKEAAIQIGTFLGGPLVAGYLIAANYKQLGEVEKVKKTWVWTIVGFIVYMFIAAIVPPSVPAIVFAAGYTAIVALLVQTFQAAKIKAHIAAGGAIYKTRRAALIGLCAGLVFLALVFGIVYLAETYSAGTALF